MTTEASTSAPAGATTGGSSVPVLRPTHGTDAALRVSVTGPGGHADLVVPFGSDVADVARSYVAATGADDGGVPALAHPGRTPLEPDAEVGDVLEQGDLLVVVAGATVSAPPAAEAGSWGEESTSLAGASSAPVLVLAALAALAAALAAVLATVVGDGLDASAAWTRPVAAGVLVAGGVLVALRSARVGTAAGHAHAVAPALAGGAGLALAWSPGRGGALLALADVALAAAVVAAVARTGADDDAGEQVLRVWILGGGTLGAAAVGWLLVGAGPLALAVVALAGAVVATRVLPSFVVDVDDDVLLDLDRLAVTAWSAREAPRGGRRRHQVRLSMVREVVAHSRRAVLAGVVVSSGTAAVAAPVVLLAGLDGDVTTWASVGSLVMVALSGASFGLAGRSFRSRLPRRLLGLTGSWLALLAGTVLATRVEGAWVWWTFAAVAVVAPVVVLSAVRLGHGWRSVWWSRLGEVAETLCGAVVIALVPLAGGLFDLVRTSFG